MDKFTAIKREPCHKCDQPVFLAERFCVGAALYHRQCLKCARCGSQLKAGNFYETEIDGEFCCETCPDEEAIMRRRDETHEENSDEQNKRFSVADKVALFQRVDLELTKKSVSDEEKRASLQRLASLTLVSQDHANESSSEESETENEEEEGGDMENVQEISVDAENETNCDTNVEETAQNLVTEVEHAVEDLIRQEVEEIVTSVLREASEKVQLIHENEQNELKIEVSIPDQTDESHETKNDDKIEMEVPLEVCPKPVPRTRTLDRNKKNLENDNKIVEKSPRPARPPPPAPSAIKEKPPIKPRPVNLTPKKLYPDELNPFGSDDDEDGNVEIIEKNEPKKSLNPFGSDTEEEPEASAPKKQSTNPFGSEDEEDESNSFNASRDSDHSSKRTPVPIPRKIVSTPSSRHTLSVQNLSQHSKNFANLSHGSQEMYGSSSSLAYSDGMSTAQRRKKTKAPPPPSALGMFNHHHNELSHSSNTLDYESEESSSSRGLSSTGTTPNKSGQKKKRKAPAPPPPPVLIQETVVTESNDNEISIITNADSGIDQSLDSVSLQTVASQKRIPLSAELCDDEIELNSNKKSDDLTFRRKIVPLEDPSENMIAQSNVFEVKSNKNEEIHEKNGLDDTQICLNKSDKGKWKRRKGPAPQIPVEVRKSIKAMSPENIKRELEIIEVQQVGLEKQGVMLEKIIREKCEGTDAIKTQNNPKAVEELIMQLFDVVNEKNELFRRQAELMYMRRQYRLESEQLELDREIRKLMEEPEENKTDAEKAREEALIARLIEVVKQRNAVVDSLESDRIREKQEDASIRQSIERHAAKFEQFAQKAQNKLLKVKKDKKEKRVKESSANGEIKQKKKKNVFNRLIHPKQKTKETQIKE
uniref:CSON003170 protein n=1 Tax=Culicoides sonorensis TaxID=179676 RepID=A0A336KCS2_CULSO